MFQRRVDYLFSVTCAPTIVSVNTRATTSQFHSTRRRTTTTQRLLRAIDRGTLVTMNAPATLRIAAHGGARPAAAQATTTETRSTETRSIETRSTDSCAAESQEDVMSTENVAGGELDPELDSALTALREACVWQLNAAIEAGFVSAVDEISDSYAASERSLISRWRAKAA